MNWSDEGPSIQYVTLFFANFDPLPLSHFVTHPGTPQRTSHISDPPFLIFSRPSTKNSDKNPLYKFSLNCLRGFFKVSLVWKVLFGVVFVRSPSVRIHLLQQKVKYHLKFQVVPSPSNSAPGLRHWNYCISTRRMLLQRCSSISESATVDGAL